MNEQTIPVVDLQVHSTATWVAMNAARVAGLKSSVSDSWSSDSVLIDSKLPNDSEMLWEDVRPAHQGHDVVFKHAAGVVILVSQDRRDMRCSVFAANADIAAEWVGKLREALPPAERKEKLLDVTFWYSTATGPRSYDRQLQAPSWEEIKANYPTATRERLIQLQNIEPDASTGGKLILWQGEPGTGKTFALRALGEEWASWCRIHYVLDPERFFGEGDYLLTVILGGDTQVPTVQGQPPAAEQWRLIVLEDAGEMLTRDAKVQVGQGLARLLNLCDGLLGQGLRVLVLITTNEHVGTLHAAVSRPGRCLSQIEFERFNSTEANQWLKIHGRETLAVAKQASLADLYALVEGNESTPARAVGFGK